MTRGIHGPLCAGERIGVGGAVLRVDRMDSKELMNDAAFVLEGNVLRPVQSTTPLHQLYLVLQTMLLEPKSAVANGSVFEALRGIRGLFAIEGSILSERHGHELGIGEAASCR